MNITNVDLSLALLFVLTVHKIVRDEVANQIALEDPISSRRYLGAFEALSSIRSSQLSPLIAAILRDGTIHYLVLVYNYGPTRETTDLHYRLTAIVCFCLANTQALHTASSLAGVEYVSQVFTDIETKF